MAKIERFFHIRHKIAQVTSAGVNLMVVSPKGGGTVNVIGEEGSDVVTVKHSICSQKDAFCRRTGRGASLEKNGKTIPLKELPHYLQKVAQKVLKRHGLGPTRRAETELGQRDYGFATKYWTPPKKAETGIQLAEQSQ